MVVPSQNFAILRLGDLAIENPLNCGSSIAQSPDRSITQCPRTPSPKAPLPPEPWDRRSPRDDNQTPATLDPASAENCQSNLLSRQIPDTPPWQPRSIAIRESCTPWLSRRNPDCRSNLSRHSCARRKAAATAAPCPDICYRRSPFLWASPAGEPWLALVCSSGNRRRRKRKARRYPASLVVRPPQPARRSPSLPGRPK